MTTYVELAHEVRRFHRDRLIESIGVLSSQWDGSTMDPYGAARMFLPWNLAMVAVVALDVGAPCGPRPAALDVARLASLAANLEHPHDTDSPEQALRMVSRLLYQQWPYQDTSLEQWARPRALLLETPLPPGQKLSVLVDGWDVDLFGCTLDEFTQTGFILHAGAIRSGGRFPTSWENLEDLETFFSEARFQELASRMFVQGLGDFQAAWRQRRRELGLAAPFGTSPFITAPFLSGLTLSEPVAPTEQMIALRTGVPGIIYAGLRKWGTAFTNEVGYLVEEYVGRHLRLLDGVDVHRQVRYQTKEGPKDSADWLIVTDDAVIVVEVKAAMPVETIRTGDDAFFESHSDKLNKATRQVNRTVDQLLTGTPEFAHIPSDRPILGLAVTLGSFYMANDPMTRELLDQSNVPLAFINMGDLERIVTLDRVAFDGLVPMP